MKPKTINIILSIIFVIILSVLYTPQIIEWRERVSVYSQPLSFFKWEVFYDGSEYDGEYKQYGEYIPIQFFEPYESYFNIQKNEILCSPVSLTNNKNITQTLLPDTFSMGWYDYRHDKFRLIKIPLKELELEKKDKPLKPYESYGVKLNPFLALWIKTDGTVDYMLHDTYSIYNIKNFPSHEIEMDWNDFMPDSQYSREKLRKIILTTYPWRINIKHWKVENDEYRPSSFTAESISGIEFSNADIWRGAKSLPEKIFIQDQAKELVIDMDIEETLTAFSIVYDGYEESGDKLPESEFVIYKDNDTLKIYLRLKESDREIKLEKIKIGYL